MIIKLRRGWVYGVYKHGEMDIYLDEWNFYIGSKYVATEDVHVAYRLHRLRKYLLLPS